MNAEIPDLAHTVDAAVIAEMCDLAGQSQYRVMLDTLVTSTDSDTAVLINCLQREDWTAVAAAAHKVKGAAGLLGMTGLQQLCKRIEAHAKGGGSVADVADVAAELQRVAAANADHVIERIG